MRKDRNLGVLNAKKNGFFILFFNIFYIYLQYKKMLKNESIKFI